MLARWYRCASAGASDRRRHWRTGEGVLPFDALDFQEIDNAQQSHRCSAAALLLAPLGAQAADLVVWWDEGYYAQEDEAVAEIIAAFEQETGKQVELVFYPQDGAAGQDRGGARGRPAARLRLRLLAWRLHREMGLRRSARGSHGRHRALLEPVRSGRARPGRCCSTRGPGSGRCTRCRWAASTNHIHVWKSLLEQAGFTLDDIPKEWDAFWSFWCDEVQPAVRRATGPRRHLGRRPADVGRGRRHRNQFLQFVAAYEADYVTRDGRLVIDDPEIRQQARQGDRQLHGHLPQGLHPARFGDMGRCRQQRAVPRPGGRDDAEPDALDPQRAQARASRRLLREHRDDRMAARPGRRALSDRRHRLCRRGLQGRRPTSRPPRSSSASSSPRAGSRTISTSPASACCRRCRSCSTSRSGSTRATRTAWPR